MGHAILVTSINAWFDRPGTQMHGYIVEWDVSDVLSGFTFNLTNDANGRFAIDADSGEITVADTSQLDHDANTTHSITVEVIDKAGSFFSEDLSVTIDDALEAIDNPPTNLSSGIALNTDDGNDAYLEANAGTIFDGLDSLTFEVSFSTSNEAGTTLVSYVSGTSEELEILLRSSGQLDIELGNRDVRSTAIDYSLLADGQLHSLAFSWDNTHGDWFIYVDGELVDSGSGLNAGDTLQGSGTLFLGQNNGPAGITAPSNNFEGTYYDVRVWNTARSEIEIALNHQRKFDPTALPSDLVANWQMDGFSGTGNNQITNVVNTGADLTIKHATGDGFVAGIPTDFLNIDENTANGSSVGFVVPTDPDEPQNLVNDGLFTSRDTTGHVEEGDTIGGPDGHWLVTNGNIDVIQNAPSPLGGNGLDLIGNQPGAVSQTIATVPGGSYQVVFAVSGNFQQGLNAVELNASAANSSFDYQVDRPDNWTLTDFQWGHRTFTFTADSNTTDLQFKSLNPSAGFFGPVISDVQVIQIPAAVTHALNNDPSLRYDAATGKFYQPVATAVDYDTAAENASLAPCGWVDLTMIRKVHGCGMTALHFSLVEIT